MDQRKHGSRKLLFILEGAHNGFGAVNANPECFFVAFMSCAGMLPLHHSSR